MPDDPLSAMPESKSKDHSCSGQTRVVPPTSPSHSGPPRCGHCACVAKTRPSRVRNTAMPAPFTRTLRPSPSGISEAGPSRTLLLMSSPENRQRVSELVGCLRRVALEPRVVGRLDRLLHRPVQLRGDPLAVVDHDRPDPIHADALDEGVRPLLVLGVLAVVLHEASRDTQDVLLAIDGAEQVSLADVGPGRSAHVDFPLAALDRDGADVLHERLGAIAGATRGRELQLARAVEAPEALLDSRREAHAVAQTEAAVVGADAALAGAVALRPSVAGGHAEVAPYSGQILLGDSDQIDALAPRQLDEGHGVLVRDGGDSPQVLRRTDSSGDLRDDGEGAVFLDVAVYAVVDEAGIALVDVLALPYDRQQ